MANALGEEFCLKWNDFENNISSSFRDLREDEAFFDVTLACEDNQLQAHKVILSACSPFFKSLLMRNPHEHPLLYLKGISYNNILAVLNFMYDGEVNVAQEELNSFLAAAEELKVKGLAQSEQQNGRVSNVECPAVNKRTSDIESTYEQSPRPVKRRKISSIVNDTVEEIEEYSNTWEGVEREPSIEMEVPVLVELNEEEHHNGGQLVESVKEVEYEGDESLDCSISQDYGTLKPIKQSRQDTSVEYTDFESFFSQNTVKLSDDVKGLQCLICSKVLDEVWKMKQHFEANHYHGQYKCMSCVSVFKTKNSLSMHRKRKGH